MHILPALIDGCLLMSC